MERILVFSDTHGSIEKAYRVFENIMGVTGVIHLGDYIRDAEKLEDWIYPVPMYYVAGNNDIMHPCPTEKLFTIGGKKFFLTHGHYYVRFGDISKLKEAAKEKEADIVLFGHTHMAFYEKENGVIYANPGSTSYPRLSARSYGIVEIEDGEIRYCNISIE